MVRQNPYTADTAKDNPYGEALPYGEPNPRYAAPSRGAPYLNTVNGGWSPVLRTSPENIPDASRLQQIPLYEFYPDGKTPKRFYESRDRDDKARHSVETQDADGWEEQKNQLHRALPPLFTPPPEPRPMTRMSPSNYRFLRPFDQLSKGNGARQFNGMHFSMADHRRTYEIGGMIPQSIRDRRNTFRLDPAPWDTNIVDMPPATGYPSARIQGVDIPPRGNGSWRL